MINATIFKMAQRAKIDGLGGERSKIEQFGMFQSSLVKSINDMRNPLYSASFCHNQQQTLIPPTKFQQLFPTLTNNVGLQYYQRSSGSSRH